MVEFIIMAEKSSGEFRFAIVALVAMVAVALMVGLSIWVKTRVGCINQYGDVKIGMRDVDVTVAFGRKPDCDYSGSSDEKIWSFNEHGACDVTVYLRSGENAQFNVTGICGKNPPDKRLESVFYEKDLIEVLGDPSSSSIRKDGLSKILNYNLHNISVDVSGARIQQWCVTQSPLSYKEEYKVGEISAPRQKQGNNQPVPPVQGHPSASAKILPDAVTHVLQYASANDWNNIDLATEQVQLPGLPSGGRQDRAAARNANSEGKAALLRNDYEQAISAFKRGVDADSNDVEILNNLGYALSEGGRPADASPVLGEVLRRVPRRANAWANLSTVLAEIGQDEQAKAALKVALHFSSHRARTLAFLRKESESARSEAVRGVNGLVYLSAGEVPDFISR